MGRNDLLQELQLEMQVGESAELYKQVIAEVRNELKSAQELEQEEEQRRAADSNVYQMDEMTLLSLLGDDRLRISRHMLILQQCVAETEFERRHLEKDLAEQQQQMQQMQQQQQQMHGHSITEGIPEDSTWEDSPHPAHAQRRRPTQWVPTQQFSSGNYLSANPTRKHQMANEAPMDPFTVAGKKLWTDVEIQEMQNS